jgi:hypothetical protein
VQVAVAVDMGFKVLRRENGIYFLNGKERDGTLVLPNCAHKAIAIGEEADGRARFFANRIDLLFCLSVGNCLLSIP